VSLRKPSLRGFRRTTWQSCEYGECQTRALSTSWDCHAIFDGSQWRYL